MSDLKPSYRVEYNLAETLEEHDNAVRSVMKMGLGFVTGARDHTIKFWSPDMTGSYEVGQIFVESKCVVSSLCLHHPNEEAAEGIILVGSMDGKIYGFTLKNISPIFVKTGHANNVSALCAGPGFFVSGSWDHTARIWSDNRNATLTGHQEAVWDIAIYPPDKIVTVSADCTGRIWSGFFENEIICEHVIIGHTDCVRGVVVSPDKVILTCSNDGTIRMWDGKGRFLNMVDGSSDYIYSITLFPDGVSFAACDEQGNVIIFEDRYRRAAVIHIEKKTLWSVAALENNALVVGANDGKVHIIRKSIKEVAQEVPTVKAAANYPMIEYVYNIAGNFNGMEKMLTKIAESNESCGISMDQVKAIMLLTNPTNCAVQEEQIEIVGTLLTLQKNEEVLPIMDLLRCAVRYFEIRAAFVNATMIERLLNIIANCNDSSGASIAIKVILNLFGFPDTKQLLYSNRARIYRVVIDALDHYNFKIHKAVGALFLNFSIAYYKEMEGDLEMFCDCIFKSMKIIDDPIALTHLLIACGTLCTKSEDAFLYLHHIKTFIYMFENVENGKFNQTVDLICIVKSFPV